MDSATEISHYEPLPNRVLQRETFPALPSRSTIYYIAELHYNFLFLHDYNYNVTTCVLPLYCYFYTQLLPCYFYILLLHTTFTLLLLQYYSLILYLCSRIFILHHVLLFNLFLQHFYRLKQLCI